MTDTTAQPAVDADLLAWLIARHRVGLDLPVAEFLDACAAGLDAARDTHDQLTGGTRFLVADQPDPTAPTVTAEVAAQLVIDGAAVAYVDETGDGRQWLHSHHRPARERRPTVPFRSVRAAAGGHQ